MTLAQGQDRSNWQTVGPWTGLSFGIAKATEGLTYHDPTFRANYNAMHAEGVHKGAYHFFHPQLDGAAQAHFFLDFVQPSPGDILVADIEILVGADGALEMSPRAVSRSHLLTHQADGKTVVYKPDAVSAGLHLLRAVEGALGHDRVPASLTASATASSGGAAFLSTLRAECPHNWIVTYTDLSVAATLAACEPLSDLWIAYPALSPPSLAGTPWAGKGWAFWQFAFAGGYDNCDRDVYSSDAAALTARIAGFSGPVGAYELPTFFSQTPYADSVDLGWGAPANAVPGTEPWYHYQVNQISGDGGGIVADNRVQANSAKVAGLIAGTNYEWRLAVGQDHVHFNSPWSAWRPFHTP